MFADASLPDRLFVSNELTPLADDPALFVTTTL